MEILYKEIDVIASRIIEAENLIGAKGHDSNQTRMMQSSNYEL